MRSIIKPFPKARYSSAFSSKIIVKDYVVAAYLSDRLFLAIGHIFIKDFLQRFLADRQPQTIRINSV